MIRDTFNVNSKVLLRSLRSMLDISQMNDSMWLMAREDPQKFIEFVDVNFTDLQKDFEDKFKVSKVFPRLVIQHAMPSLGSYHSPKKIELIKMIRVLDPQRMGLADAKQFAETLPRDFKIFYCDTIQDAQTSWFQSYCSSIGVDVQWVLVQDEELHMVKNLKEIKKYPY